MPPSNNSTTPTNRTDWTAQEDLIAPTHTSSTTTTLQRWALATATLPSKGYRWKEAQIVQRVRRRYETDTVVGLSRPFPKYSEKDMRFSGAGDGGDRKGNDMDLDVRDGRGKYEQDAKNGAKKRKLSISPPLSGRTMSKDESPGNQDRGTKRRRRGTSPSPFRQYERSADQEESDAESSVWSFPGSEDEDRQGSKGNEPLVAENTCTTLH